MAGMDLRYTVLPTGWGYFGLAADRTGLCRTCLPTPDRDLTLAALLSGQSEDPRHDHHLMADLQDAIVAYFEGQEVEFAIDIGPALAALPETYRKLLAKCFQIPYGQVLTYGELAANTCMPRAARVAGMALANNPIPLIIPCHRVIRSNGGLGGFSALGGVALKQRLLVHEGLYRPATASKIHPSP